MAADSNNGRSRQIAGANLKSRTVMEKAQHTFTELFRQLGLPADRAYIEQFILTHKPLEPGVMLSNAPFWNPAQKDFLKKALQDDADWAPLVDQLNAELR